MQQTLTEKQRFWLDHVRACSASGQSMRVYADANGLKLADFYSSKAALRRKGALDDSEAATAPLFRKAKVVDGRNFGRCRVLLPSGLALEVDCSAEPAWVAQLVHALSAA